MGRPNQCEQGDCIGIFRDGGFARFSVVPARAVYRIAPDLPTEQAVYAELLSCVMGGTDKVRIQPGESAVILGAGPAGMMFLLAFKAAGAGPVIVVEGGEYRRECAHRLGADAVLDPEADAVEARVLEMTTLGADIVVDAVGTQLGRAVGLVARGGKILLFGMNQQALPSVCQNDITRNEVSVLGTYIGIQRFQQVIKALESGAIRPAGMTTHLLPLDQIHAGFAAARARQALKVVLLP
jgi:(R,R)-butanediol dehydrogenase / meso-butanediol dehydrogenase / diacetyl reductase